MKWIDAKMQELGVTKNPNYKISFHLDSLAMITVQTPKYGLIDVSGALSQATCVYQQHLFFDLNTCSAERVDLCTKYTNSAFSVTCTISWWYNIKQTYVRTCTMYVLHHIISM